MSMTIMAQLGYGFSLGDPENWDWGTLGKPWKDPTPEEINQIKAAGHWDDTYDEEWDEQDVDEDAPHRVFYANWAELCRLRNGWKLGGGDKGFLVTIETYCTSDQPSYVVFVKDSIVTAYHEKAKPIRSGKLYMPSPGLSIWQEQIRDWCASMGVRYETPDWVLTAYFSH